jgi:outer membrane protein OmpA-like peptidoglycan-associated protein
MTNEELDNFLNSNQKPPESIDLLLELLTEIGTLESGSDDRTKNSEITSETSEIETVEVSLVDPEESFKTIEEVFSKDNAIDYSLEVPIEKPIEITESETQKQTRQETRNPKTEDPEKILETATAVNALIPLIVELLNSKIDFSKDTILEAVAPEIDRLIEKRTEEDRQKMGAAIARILPDAIGIEIRNSPQQIAKAIAPEVAIAIQEQIRLDRNAISRALGSEMGKAIKNQIEIERDAMVDALYPVIGSTVSKYMVDVVKDINEKVERALTPEGIKRKIRAKVRGVSEAELILQESVGYQVQAIFLIHKASGLIVEEVQSSQLDRKLESDLLAGMLTAIRSFVNDCISLDRTSELNEIEYGDVKILLEVGGYCYLAAIVKGGPSKQFIASMRETLSQIILEHGEKIEAYDGDPLIIPSSVQTLLTRLFEDKVASTSNKKPTALFVLLGVILLLVGVPWGCSQYHQNFAARVNTNLSQELDSAPELSVYRLTSEVRDGRLILQGRVGSDYLRKRAEEIAAEIASQEKLKLDNQIVAVDVPFDPTLAAAEIQRTTNLLNQRAGVAIVTDYQPKTLTIEGVVLDNRNIEEITEAFRAIPSVDTIVVRASPKLPQVDRRILFEPNVTEVEVGKMTQILQEIVSILQQNPQLHLKVIGHADISGEAGQNRQLKEKRSANIKIALTKLGIAAERIQALASSAPPPALSNRDSLALSRCVRFEVFIPNKTKQ